MTKLSYAEEAPYWRTSQSSPDVWIDRAKRQIAGAGGQVLMEAFGHEPTTGRAAFVLGFQIGSDRYRLTWPVLPSKTANDRAARIQAATMLYHDVKARCVSAVVLGPRAAFLPFLLLPDGRVAGEASTPELARQIPAMFASSAPQLGPGKEKP